VKEEIDEDDEDFKGTIKFKTTKGTRSTMISSMKNNTKQKKAKRRRRKNLRKYKKNFQNIIQGTVHKNYY